MEHDREFNSQSLASEMELDPLRTFELDEKQWKRIVASAVSEGAESWDEFAPSFIAAIELGYYDKHLHMIALWLRQRYLFLKGDAMAEAPKYMPTMTRPPAAGVAFTEEDLMPQDGIQPLRPEAGFSRKTGEFVFRGYIFSKGDFIGKVFKTGVPARGSYAKIVSVGTQNFTVDIVQCPDARAVGRRMHFNQERNPWLFNIPKS